MQPVKCIIQVIITANKTGPSVTRSHPRSNIQTDFFLPTSSFIYDCMVSCTISPPPHHMGFECLSWFCPKLSFNVTSSWASWDQIKLCLESATKSLKGERTGKMFKILESPIARWGWTRIGRGQN